jgi:predicted glycoside hydrolase/deacetylase ChbG (UPF0249 family)
MVEARILRLIPHLPDGVSEIYFHPAARGDRRAEELATLLSPLLRDRIAELGIRLVSYSDL